MARIREQPRKNARLPGYDYSLPGAYFITIVSKHRETLFDDRLLKSVVDRSWRWLGVRYEHVEIDAFVVMPNHLHGLLMITDARRGRSRAAPTNPSSLAKPLGQLIGAFKTTSTKQINRIRRTAGLPVWQRNYYEHVIRNEDELNRIRQYILDNPAKWDNDPENPAALHQQTVD